MVRLSLVTLALIACSTALPAFAQNPDWPAPLGSTAEDMRNPRYWPSDPGWGYDTEGDGSTCIDDAESFCWTNTNGGQWNMWSWTPTEATERDNWRPAENEMGAGAWTDLAWTMTTGNRDTLIAVLDSGIKWDERDLINQYFINQAELEAPGLDVRCLPQVPAGHTGDPVDIDGDGSLSMRDYFEGHDAAFVTMLQAELDSMGNNNGVAEPGDLIVLCTDGVDDDANGYADDISGWDFFNDDNDPSDDTRFGHGTGEAKWSAGEANNGMGEAGFCPGCSILMVRAADSFVGDSNDFGQSVIYATDRGADVIQEALGTINNTTYMRRSVDYAYANDVIVIASAADENSRHHNLPGTVNHNVYVHAIRFAGAQPQTADSFLAFNNCTNYGGQLQLSAAGTGCSSEATGVSAGISGLIVSAANSADRPGGPIDPPLSAEEVRQLLNTTAQDIDVPESDPSHPDYESDWYPSVEGWDQRFGYGRANAFFSTRAAWEGKIPPEVDIVMPHWFQVVYPERTPNVVLEGHMDARRADSFDYVIEWARDIEPADDAWETLDSGTGITEALSGELFTWDISALEIDNEGEAENRYTVTVRIRVTANYAAGPVLGETRRVFAIHRDPTLRAGFPIALGVRDDSDIHPGSSGEGAPVMADIDGDDKVEVVYGDADGLLHVFNEDATEAPGFPVRLGTLRGFDPADPNNHLAGVSYASGDVPSGDVSPSLLATPAIGDLDGDGTLEIVAATIEGDIYVVSTDGSIRDGWPVGLPEVPSSDTLRGGPSSRESIIERGIFASPALGDLDSDGELEVVIAAFDGSVYVFRADGSAQPGWPVGLTAPVLWVDDADAAPGRIMTSPAIGDVDGDGILDIAVGSNEKGDDPNSGVIHLLHGDGNDHAGGSAHDNWPIKLTSLDILPLVGEGTTSAVSMADINDDGLPDLAITATASRIFIVNGIQPPRGPGEEVEPLLVIDSARRGPLSNINDTILLNTFATGGFTDLDQDGQPDFTTGGAGLKLAANLAGGYKNSPFDHQLGVWSTSPDELTGRGSPLPGFPQRVNDYMFFVNPTSADVDGDDYPEVIVGTGGYYMHAFDACGNEPEGWPKFLGGWITASAAFGDVDGDGLLEVALTTRHGYMFLWDTDGPADGATPWPEYRHDNHNTGNFEEPLSNGGAALRAATPLVCDIPARPDAGVGDGGLDGDMPVDGGTEPGGGGGCGCVVAGAPRQGNAGSGFALFGMLALGLVAWRRRRG